MEDFKDQVSPKVYEESPDWAKRVLGKALAETKFIPNAERRTLNKDVGDVSKSSGMWA